jgi:hypothetical protein
MAKQKTISVEVLKNILEEVDIGLSDKTRTINSISNSTTRKIITSGSKLVIDSGGGGKAILRDISAGASVAANAAGIIVGAATLGAGGAVALGGAAAVGTKVAFAAAGAAAAKGGAAVVVLGGPVVWGIGGGVALISFLVGKGLERRRKIKFNSEKYALLQYAIVKQNRIIAKQNSEIDKLKKLIQQIETQGAHKDSIIDALAKRIDYLNGLLCATNAVVEVCT